MREYAGGFSEDPAEVLEGSGSAFQVEPKKWRVLETEVRNLARN